MRKSTKRFVLSDSGLNSYKFRLLTEGCDLSLFEKNPVMLYGHVRTQPWDKTQDQILPIGVWEDIAIEGDQLMATPSFDENDEFAMKIYQKVEDGVLRMASVGFDPIAKTEDPEYLLPGQQLSTVTKWLLKEASIVDIGANGSALALYDDTKQELVTLSADNVNDYLNSLNIETMSKLTINLADAAALVGLAANNVTEEAVTAKIKELAATAQEVVGLKKTNQELTTKVTNLEKEAAAEKVTALIDKGIAEGRITEGEREELTELAGANFESVEKLIAKRPEHKTAEQKLAGASEGGADDPLLKLSYKEAHEQNKLADIKESNPDHYAKIFEAHFGKKPNA